MVGCSPKKAPDGESGEPNGLEAGNANPFCVGLLQ
jgi:hypothetical protein